MPHNNKKKLAVNELAINLLMNAYKASPYSAHHNLLDALPPIAVADFIDVTTSQNHPKNASEISREMKIPRSTLLRILANLVKRDRIRLVDGRYVSNPDAVNLDLPSAERDITQTHRRLRRKS